MRRFGVALDIDGVLLRGAHVIPNALPALQRLAALNIPTIFLTNGGGVTEEKKASDLSYKIGFPVQSDQIVMSHTPFQSLLPQYRQSKILVVGGESCTQVAKHYGFAGAVSSLDLHRIYPDIYPTKSPIEDRPRATTSADAAHSADISAALIFGESVDWGLDIQVLTDLAMRHSMGPVSGQGSSADVNCSHFPIFACNADIVYSAAHSQPRYTQGAFVHSFSALFQHYASSRNMDTNTSSNNEAQRSPAALYPRVDFYGKPFKVQYDYALRTIDNVAKRSGVDSPVRYYGVGDNPRSDVRGANLAGSQWRSVLVRTGLFRGNGNDAVDVADYVEYDVLDAVNRIISVEEQLE